LTNTLAAAGAVAERCRLERETFLREVMAGARPAVLRGQVREWPAVQAASRGDAALADWLLPQAGPEAVEAVLVPPPHEGRLFYAEPLHEPPQRSPDGRKARDFNFLRNRLPLADVIAQVLRYASFERAPAVAVQSAAMPDCWPAFTATHAQPLLDETVMPRLWLGNAIVTPTHFDESHNLACVVAGTRRVTLFPPHQVGNLYIGPIGHAPTGTPISLVDVRRPDLERSPRFASAWSEAQQVLLHAGDALYIPPLWWHHVESLRSFNVMVNYWWHDEPATRPSGMGALLLAMLALRDFPPEQRRAWAALFRHWVFEADATTTAHLPPHLLGVHGEFTPQTTAMVQRLVRAQVDRG
jgi:hypothetical protein